MQNKLICLRFFLIFLSLAIILFITQVKPKSTPNQNILINFDNKRAWGTSPETGFKINLSQNHKTEGKYSLEVIFPVADYPSINTRQFSHFWESYNSFNFDVYNPQDEKINFALRLDDDHNARFNQTLILFPGQNHINIPRTEIAKQINPRIVDYIVLYLVKPNKSYKLYFDNMQLQP